VTVSISKVNELSVNGLEVTSGGTHVVGDWLGDNSMDKTKSVGELVGLLVGIWGVLVLGLGDTENEGNGLLVGINVFDVLLGVATGNVG